MNCSTPLFSIIIPVYNVEKYLHNSVKSVLSQGNYDYELILVDDGSTDGCPAICDEYARKHSDKIRVVHQENAGQAVARNAGAVAAIGKYIYFLDSDDTIQPDTLEHFTAIIEEQPEIDMIFSYFQRVKEDEQFKPSSHNEGVKYFSSKEEIQNAFLTREYVILAPGTLYRKEWLDNNQLRFRPNPYSEDQLFVWECLLHIGKIAVVKSDLYNYLDRPGSIMTSSKYQKIIAAYPFFKELERQYQMSNQSSALAKRFLLPRWVGGIFHSAAKLCNYKEYTFLLDSFEASIHLKELKSFPNIKIKLLSMVFFVSKRLYYLLNRAI